MSDTALIIALPLLVFLITFPILWTGISSIHSMFGGRSVLAERFKTSRPSTGKNFGYASALFRKNGSLPVTYRWSLNITIGNEGIHLSVLFLFRFHSPAFLISWKHIENVAEQRHLFGRYVVINI